jgi:quinol monooxygenase YgiN
MKLQFSAVAIAAAIGFAGAAWAEPYVDYTPQKGVWHVTTIKVEPSHLDDYVTGLKHTWQPGEEIAKKHGLIDSYQLMVKLNLEDGQGNVLLIEHYPSIAALDADQTRDQAMQKEAFAALPKAQSDAAVAGFDKYRTFVGDDYWTEMTFTK